MSDKIDELLAERGKVHGDFTSHAHYAQCLKNVMKSGEGNWLKLTHAQREALEMIQHKVGRILNGDPNHRDHWDDIAGYARLAAERCLSVQVPNSPQGSLQALVQPVLANYGQTNDQGEVWDGTGWVDPDFLKPRKAAE